MEKVRTDQDERIVRLFLNAKARQLEPLVAEVQNKVASQTALSSSEFFDLLDRLNQLAKSLKGTSNNEDKSAA